MRLKLAALAAGLLAFALIVSPGMASAGARLAAGLAGVGTGATPVEKVHYYGYGYRRGYYGGYGRGHYGGYRRHYGGYGYRRHHRYYRPYYRHYGHYGYYRHYGGYSRFRRFGN